jgi:large subunit ribosomal protein L15
MNLADVYAIRVPHPERRRVGRGWGSGLGKTSGRGEKGAGRFEGVNVGAVERAFAAGAKVDIDTLRNARLVPKSATLWKLLGDGTLTKALKVSADAASAGARTKIEKSGGTLEVIAGAARARLEAGAARREAHGKTRVVEIEAYKATAVKAGKPKKAAAPVKKAKAAGGGGGGDRPKGGGGKPGAKDGAPKKDQG